MKHIYEIEINSRRMTDYVRGRINGMIYTILGKPDIDYGWSNALGRDRWLTKVECSRETLDEIIKTIGEEYGGILIEIREVG